MQNKKSSLKLLSGLLIATFLTGCSSDIFNKEDLGTSVGISVGSILGSAISNDNIILTLVSTAGLGYIGNKIGKEMDENDKKNE